MHPSGQGILGQYVHLLKLGQYVAGTICHWDNMSLGQYVAGQNVPSVQLKIHSLFIVIIMKCVSVFAYLCMQICVYVFVILFLLLPNGGREGVADQLSLLL